MGIKVAVTMSTYNGVEWLKNVSIPSLRAQHHLDWALFVTHDGFEEDKLDSTFEAVQSFNDPRIRFSAYSRFLPPTDQQNWPIGSREWGIAGYNALNHSLESIKRYNQLCDRANLPQEKFKYIFHLDQDDAFHPAHMENLITLLENNPDVDLAYAHTDFYLNDRFNGTLSGAFDRARLLSGNYIAHSSIAYRSDDAPLYSLEGHEPSDYNYLKQFLTRGKPFVQSPETTFLYYQRCSVEFAVKNLRERGILK